MKYIIHFSSIPFFAFGLCIKSFYPIELILDKQKVGLLIGYIAGAFVYTFIYKLR